MYIPGIKTVIYMVSLQNKFQKQNEILDRKGSNYLIYFLFLSLLNWIKNGWLCIDMPSLFDIDTITFYFHIVQHNWSDKKLKSVKISLIVLLHLL